MFEWHRILRDCRLLGHPPTSRAPCPRDSTPRSARCPMLANEVAAQGSRVGLRRVVREAGAGGAGHWVGDDVDDGRNAGPEGALQRRADLVGALDALAMGAERLGQLVVAGV